MTEKIVITGINGFVGHHLAKHIKEQGLSVIGVGFDETINSDIEDIVDSYYQADLSINYPAIDSPRAIIHLAGLAAVGPSFDDPQRYISANSAMLTNICEFYLKQEVKPRILVVSSGAVYSPDQVMPIDESGKIGYSSPYVISKMLNEAQVEYYRNRGLDCVIVRPFNHIGPGQAEGFILPDLYKRISGLTNEQTVISVGNIDTKRDYTDVRDIVRAYSKIALTEELGAYLYNVCSGQSLSGGDIFNILAALTGRDDLTYEVDQKLIRPTDAPEIVGNSSRLQTELDWHPTFDIQSTVADFVQSKRQ